MFMLQSCVVLLFQSQHLLSTRHRITKTSPLTGKPSAMLDTVEGGETDLSLSVERGRGGYQLLSFLFLLHYFMILCCKTEVISLHRVTILL